jgi:protocatechuate 3,4-dioxygenase beta subunit
MNRRQALGALSAAVSAAISGACTSSPASPSATSSTTSTMTTGGTTSALCAEAPGETIGPYPDRTGMLSSMAFYRRDVTEGRPGTPLTLTITIQNTNANCAALANAAVEIWQCDVDGHYSEYAQGNYNGTGFTYLRGFQVTDANGQVTFNTVYPGWYQGRATHIHVQMYVNNRSVKVTQIAFPESVSSQIYASGVYASRGSNPTTNASDNVFSDGVSLELASVTASGSGYLATITFGVPA